LYRAAGRKAFDSYGIRRFGRYSCISPSHSYSFRRDNADRFKFSGKDLLQVNWIHLGQLLAKNEFTFFIQGFVKGPMDNFKFADLFPRKCFIFYIKTMDCSLRSYFITCQQFSVLRPWAIAKAIPSI
jgi:hypothetical protein